MVLRPEDIEERQFGSALRGFDKAEVRAFLRRVAGEVRFLESELESARQDPVPHEADDDSESEVTEPSPDPTPPSLVERLTDAAPTPIPSPVDTPSSSASIDAPPAPPLQSAVPPPAAHEGSGHDPDRFAALGDRIANVLRSAQETAEQVRGQAVAEADALRVQADTDSQTVRAEADAYAAETRSAAAAEVGELVATAQAQLASAHAEAAEIREHARADADEMRSAAGAELEAVQAEVARIRTETEIEAADLRAQAVADGEHSLSGREAQVAEQEVLIARERKQAMAELSDARSQVSTLLQEARAQGEFIRQESEEIIRTKIRANMEQAQRRIDILRTTETASKDRIAAARRELESALARLESEPVPGLVEGTEDHVLEEAQQRVIGSQEAAAVATEAFDVRDSGVIGGEIVDVEARSFGPASEPGDATPVGAYAGDVSTPPEPYEHDPFSESVSFTESGSPQDEAAYSATVSFEETVTYTESVSFESEPAWSAPDPTVPGTDDDRDATLDDVAEPDVVTDIDTPENEDALAKLVREAMQRAVDTARGNES